MFSEEKWESSSKSSSKRVHKRRDRKMWKKPIKISRLPSFEFSGSDFTVDQIPVIFSGYTAESEDSSSSQMSDDSRTYSKSSDENEEVDQERSRSVKKRPKLESISRMSSMKALRRQSTRKLYGGGQRLKKMRSMKRLTSNSRNILRKKNLDSISREDFGLLQPHYLRPTSSSASKNVENVPKDLGVARLKRLASLRYKGLLKATCSSAMKGSSSKKSNDVCTYRYCSLHGRHSHAADNNVSVPSLKRFVSMRRKFLKRQKSVNRRLLLLKRTLSTKRGPLGGRIVTDQDSKQVDDNADKNSDEEVFEEEVSGSDNDSESIGRSIDTVMVGVDGNGDGGMDSMETVASAGKQWVQESKPEILDDSNGRSDIDMTNNAAQWHGICKQTVTGLDHDDVKVEEVKSEETVGDTEEVCREGLSGELREEDGKKTVGGNEEVCREGSSEEMREEDGKKTVNVWNETVTLVKQAFDEILAEITDDESSSDISITKDEPLEGRFSKEDAGGDLSDSSSSDMQPIQGRDTHLSVIVSNIHMGDDSDHQRGPKKWGYLKRVILLKRFLKSLDRKEKRKLPDGEESETIMRLRRDLVGERKNAEEWMLDHALRQVISTLSPSQKRKVKHLVKAFESLNPTDGVFRDHNDLGSPGREKEITMNTLTQTILRDKNDTTDLLEVLPAKDLEETKLTCEASSSLSIDMKSDEALESVADASICNYHAVEEEVDGSFAGSFIEEEEKTRDSEKKNLQNLSTWRNLIQKHMAMRDNSEGNPDDMAMRDNSEGNPDETEQEKKWPYGTDQMTGIEDGNAAAVKSIHLAFETILSEIPDSSSDEEIVSESSNSLKEEKENQGDTRRSWNRLRKVMHLKRFVNSLEKVQVFNPGKLQNLPVESPSQAENVFLRHRSIMEGRRMDGEELMLDYALRQAISRLAPIQRKKVELLVQAFDTVLDGHDTPKQTNTSSTPRNTNENGEEGKPKLEDDCEVNKDDQKIKNVFARFQVHQKDLKREEEVDSRWVDVEEEAEGSLAGSFIKEEEKKGDSEKQNLSTWRNLIQKHMAMSDNSEGTLDETEQEQKWSYGTDQMTGIEDGNAAAVKSIQLAFEAILSEIPDSSSDEETVSESSNSLEEEKGNQGETKRSWNRLRKVILLKRFVNSLEKVQVFNPRKLRNLPVESALQAENVFLRHRSIMEGRRTDGEELMLDYALRQAISRLAPVQRKKVELLVQAFDTVLDGHDTPKQTNTSSTPRNTDENGEEGKSKLEDDFEVNKDEQKIKNVFSRFQVHQKDLKGEEEVVSTPKESRSLPPIGNVKQRIVIEKEKDSRMWKLIYKHMVTEKDGTDSAIGESVASVDDECDDEAGGLQIDARRSGTVTLVREALEKILSEIPDNSSDDHSMDSDITTDQELSERNSQVSEELVSSAKEITFRPKSNEKRVKGWNNVKKVILLKRFVSDLGSLTRLSPKTPRVLPWEPDPETEKIRLRHQEIGGKKNSEEWMLDYALRQAISTLAPSQKRKVSLLAQAFDMISLQDMGSGSIPSSAATSRNISRQSSISSTVVHNENEGNAEILRERLRNLQEDLKESTKLDGVANDSEEQQQCSSLWRLLCKQMEDNERNQALPEETIVTRKEEEEEEEESKHDTNVDGEKMELYETEAVELLGEVIDGISLDESQDQNLIQGETKQKRDNIQVSKVRIDQWSKLKRAILLRKFVKALENVRKFNPREPRFLPPNPEVEAEKVNLRHQETQNKKNGNEWMVDNALQGVVSKLTPARKLKVQLLVQAFETLSATGN